MNLKIVYLIFLLGLMNLKSVIGYKCVFYSGYDTYTCKVQSDSSGIIEKHISSKNDNDVTSVEYNGTLNGVEHLTQSEFPFCQRFQNLDRVTIELGVKSLDENLLQQCKDLKKVGIYRTKIEEIPENLFSRNSKLKDLGIRQSNLTTLPENIFANQKELEVLSLGFNKINFLPPNIFKSLTKLQDLYLNHNQIQALDPACFKHLEQLQFLSIDKNKVSELPKNIFKDLVNLEHLDLNNNQLKSIHSDSFGIHRKLEYLFSNNNRINAIDEKFIDNTAVSNLDMSGNICSQEEIGKREEMKEKLKKCFENYQPRD